MKIQKLILIAFCSLAMSTISFGQEATVSELFSTLSKMSDQFNDSFDPKVSDKNTTLIFVEGTDTAFPEIYAKFKGKKLVKNVRVVAGWKNVMPGTEYESKFKHMTDGFKSNEGLGKEGYSVLFDLNSESHELLNLNKYSIVNINKMKDEIDVQDFGSDRVEFLKAIRQFFN